MATLQSSESHFLSVFQDLPSGLLEPLHPDGHEDVVSQTLYRFEQEGFTASNWLNRLLDASALGPTTDVTALPSATDLLRHRMMHQLRGEIQTYWTNFLNKLRTQLLTVQANWNQAQVEQEAQHQASERTSQDNSGLRKKLSELKEQANTSQHRLEVMEEQISLRDSKLAQQRTAFYHEVLGLRNQIVRLETEKHSTTNPKNQLLVKSQHSQEEQEEKEDSVEASIKAQQLGARIESLELELSDTKAQLEAKEDAANHHKGLMDGLKEQLSETRAQADAKARSLALELATVKEESAREICRLAAEWNDKSQDLENSLGVARRNMDAMMTELQESQEATQEALKQADVSNKSVEALKMQLVETEAKLDLVTQTPVSYTHLTLPTKRIV
eukprot:TRINITY_DN20080_c0_g1_i2.p1 TRINITY_DN20080_c0_g1~~TRINITY_DN20080_c0_g1_i2.p1  ORF type:complete len:387 (+),score=93.46 TRINITY_DN20080_c0_g1_i2:391-1551(+)